MSIETIDDLNDPRLEPYHALKDRVLKERSGRFIAEGHRVTERLLASALDVDSVLVSDKRVEALRPNLRAGVPVYVASEALMERVAGFHIHTGVLSIGVRPERPSLGDVLVPPEGAASTVLICEKIKEPVNMGAMIRIAVAMGASGLVIGPECVDAYYRRAVRASMGMGFGLPIRRSDDLIADCRALRDEHGCELCATVLADDAEVLQTSGRDADKPLGIVLGHEVDGVTEGLVECCDRGVVIPMYRGSDSLNVAVSAAIFLYHFMPTAD